jgi:CarD family transcriptional regulator
MFKPGDKVVYPHHGAAVVEKREKRKDPTGQTTEYLVLRMAHGDMTLAVPVANAEDVGMRWPISKEDVEDHQEKLKSGDVYQVAEVVRNLALRDQAKGLSAGEKMLYTKALDVLVSELAFALNTSEEKAMATVEDALS